ncbi:MAG: FG-GAP repeat protein [Thermoplasmata archaeon]|nr:MAG: FG-GAP repeat protein [Thermoplasmata archaeon]
MDSSSDINLTGENDGDKFGFSVHSAGDIDGDGALDIIVGAPYWDNSTTADCGRVYIFCGGSSMDATADYHFNGTQSNGHFGWSVTLALKFDGGSKNVIIVGMPHYDTQSTEIPSSASNVGQVIGMVIASEIIPEFSEIAIPILISLLTFSIYRSKSIKKMRKKKPKTQTKKEEQMK